MAGRKEKLNKKTIEALAAAISIGATQEIAARYADIGESTFYAWLVEAETEKRRLAEGGEPSTEQRPRLLLELVEAIEAAKGERAVRWLNVVNDAANVDPAWAFRMLERLHEGYGPPAQKTELTGKDGGPVAQVVEHRGQTHGSVEHVAAVVAALVDVGAIALPGTGDGDAAEDDALHS